MGKDQSKEEQPKEEIIKTVEKIVYVEKPEINVTFTKANSHDFKTLEEEEEFLMYHKNEVLQTQLNQVRKKFETVQSLDQVIDFKEKKDEQINNKSLLEINDNEKYCFCEYKTYLKINFNLIGLLFVISNLIGVYQLIGILKATENEITFGMQSFLFGKNRTIINNDTNTSIPFNSTNYTDYNSQSFENIYENYSFKTIPDFNLLYLSSIIGNLLLKSFGFRFSTIIYMVINVLTLIFFESFEFPEKYNFYSILLLILYYILFFLSVGGISLLSHQIYFDGLTKYIHYKESHEKSIEENIEDVKEEEEMIYNDNNKDNLIKENIFNEEEEKKNNENENEEKNKKKELEKNDKISFFTYLCLTEIPAYLIYFGINYYFKTKNYYDYFFLINIIIYVTFTIFSLIFYCCYSSIFIKGEKKNIQNQKEINVWRILGYIIYYEKKYQEDSNPYNNLNNDKSDINIYKAPCCYSCRLGIRKCLKKSDTILSNVLAATCPVFGYCFFYCCCFCCCFDIDSCKKGCCDESDLSEVNQGDEQFCFCYKVQGKFSWFCDLLFKNNILNYIEFDIFLELITIGFSKKIKENLQENEFNENFITLIIYLISFIIFVSFNRLESKECRDKVKKSFMETVNKGQEEINAQQGNISLITLVNIVFVIIFSGFSYFGSESLKNFTDKYLIIFPFALTKFYYFILLNCLINIIDYGNIDLLSNSTIVSLFLLIYKLIAFLFTDVINCSTEGLILFQFIFCLIILGIFVIVLIIAGLAYAIFWVICTLICACCCKK